MAYRQGLRSSVGMVEVSKHEIGGLEPCTILNMLSGKRRVEGWSALSQNNLDNVVFLMAANCAGVN